MLNKRWYLSQAPAQAVQNNPKEWGVSYFKHIKSTPIHGGKIVCRVIGKTKQEAEEIAAHIVGMHNYYLDTNKTEPGTETGK